MSTARTDKELTFTLQAKVWGAEQVLKAIHIPHGADLKKKIIGISMHTWTSSS